MVELKLTVLELLDFKYCIETALARTDDEELEERLETLLDKINNHELS